MDPKTPTQKPQAIPVPTTTQVIMWMFGGWATSMILRAIVGGL